MEWFKLILRKYLKDKENDVKIMHIFKEFNYFIIKFPTWEVAKLSQSCTSRAIFLNGFVGLEFARPHVNCLDRFASR